MEPCPHCQTEVTPKTQWRRAPSLLQTPRAEHVCPQCGKVMYTTGGQFSLLVKTAGLLALIQLGAAGLRALGVPMPAYRPNDWGFIAITVATAVLIALLSDRWGKRKSHRKNAKTRKMSE